MKLRPFIQCKAAFLTIVFLLNTIVGFACAVGADLGFNSDHHQDHTIIQPANHIHEIKKQHHHDEHSHEGNLTHHHASESPKDNCCKDEVAKLVKFDKLYQPGFDYNLLSLSFFILPSRVYHVGDSRVFSVSIAKCYFGRYCRPPIPDVRIGIQSFQI